MFLSADTGLMRAERYRAAHEDLQGNRLTGPARARLHENYYRGIKADIAASQQANPIFDRLVDRTLDRSCSKVKVAMTSNFSLELLLRMDLPSTFEQLQIERGD